MARLCDVREGTLAKQWEHVYHCFVTSLQDCRGVQWHAYVIGDPKTMYNCLPLV